MKHFIVEKAAESRKQMLARLKAAFAAAEILTPQKQNALADKFEAMIGEIRWAELLADPRFDPVLAEMMAHIDQEAAKGNLLPLPDSAYTEYEKLVPKG